MTRVGRMKRLREGAMSTGAGQRANEAVARQIFGIPDRTEIVLTEAHGLVGFLAPNTLDVWIVRPALPDEENPDAE